MSGYEWATVNLEIRGERTSFTIIDCMQILARHHSLISRKSSDVTSIIGDKNVD